MTQDDQDKIIDQSRREYREAKQTLAALKKKAATLGDRMSQVGHVLSSEPENLLFAGQSHEGRFRNRIGLVNVGEFREVQNLLQMTNEIRETALRVDKLRRGLTLLEGDDPESGANSGNYAHSL
jgi:DNA anti-recombination protein RmuC